MADLVLVYGPSFTGRNAIAWAIARAMPGRSAVVSADALLEGAIAVAWEDSAAELEMAHGQLRLLVAYYLKHRYHLVVEGPFLFERDGRMISYEAHIDQLAALMRNLTLQSMVVRLEVEPNELRSRASAALGDVEAEKVVRLAESYGDRQGDNLLRFDVGKNTPEGIAQKVQAELARLRMVRMES